MDKPCFYIRAVDLPSTALWVPFWLKGNKRMAPAARAVSARYAAVSPSISTHCGSAPWSSRNSIVSTRSWRAAKCSGVRPEKSFCDRSAPASKYDCKRFVFPAVAAEHILSPISTASPWRCAPHCSSTLIIWKITWKRISND